MVTETSACAAGATRAARRADQAGTAPQSGSAAPQGNAAAEARRQSRLAALSRSCGIWAGEPDTPRDGVIYQQKLRTEWP